VGGMRKLRHRGLQLVGWMFTFAAAAYNLVRMRNLTVLSLTDPANDLLPREGTDLNYGARHLKCAIERRLVRPLSNLIATEGSSPRRLSFLRGSRWREAGIRSAGILQGERGNGAGDWRAQRTRAGVGVSL